MILCTIPLPAIGSGSSPLPFSGDFEEGYLRGWLKEKVIRDPIEVTSYPNPFDFQPTYGDNPTARGRGQPSNHQGNWWIGTYEKYQGPSSGQRPGDVQGDEPQGILTSGPFMIEPGTLSFLVGGGSDPRTRVELQLFDEMKLVWVGAYSASGKNTETMGRVTWDLTRYEGRKARIRIVDLSSDGWGHINADDFRFVAATPKTPPEARIEAKPLSGPVPLIVQFHGDKSTDRDGSIVMYEWDLGDGGSSSLQNPEHTYLKAGVYEVRLTVTDNDGTSGTTWVEVQVAPASSPQTPPEARIEAKPLSGPVPLIVQFHGDKSTDRDGTIVMYQWDFGDGSTSSFQYPEHTYQKAGVYEVRLTVTDNNEATDTAFVNIHVDEPFPLVPVLAGLGAAALILILARIRTRGHKPGSKTVPPKTGPEGTAPREKGPETAPSNRSPETAPSDREPETPPAGTVGRTAEHVVSTGFSSLDLPDSPISSVTPLKPDTDYYFWLEIGEPVEGSIETAPSAIPEVPANARLTVVVFGFGNGIKTREGANVGELEVLPQGEVMVTSQPLGRRDLLPKSELLQSRLFFPVHAPLKHDTYQLRCNIYYKQILLQSRLIHAVVAVRPTGKQALQSDLDYTLMQTFDAKDLTKFKEHKLSIFLNQNNERTHTFYFFGENRKPESTPVPVQIDRGDLKRTLEAAQETLRNASWGSAEKWKGEKNRYERNYEPGRPREELLEQLKTDLTKMAKWGYDHFDLFKRNQPEAFTLHFATPVYIQIAIESSAKLMFPAAMIYDYPLDSGFDGKYQFCPEFVDAFLNKRPLENTPCFHGNCPTLKKYKELPVRKIADQRWICPSGFWGFRHYLGMPVSVGNKNEDKNTDKIFPTIPVKEEFRVSVASAEDLKKRETHLQKISDLLKESFPKSEWNYAKNRDDLFDRVLKKNPHVVYFYCHGGEVRDKMPFLKIGPVDHLGDFYPSNLGASEILWDTVHPLVVLNGCHTAEIDPDDAFNLIDPFIQTSKSAGVIGTNITIFEEMATAFAQELFMQFFRGVPIGVAIRNSRLKVLDIGDPMGLVYIPFVYAGLHLERDEGNGNEH
jgi:PKD repeat protein